MEHKKLAKQRRSARTRKVIKLNKGTRLSVYRSNLHIYATVIAAEGGKVLATASSLEQAIKSQIDGNGGNVKAATLVGQQIAKKAREAGVEQVAFDRGGMKYHGRVKALAEAAREAGLKF